MSLAKEVLRLYESSMRRCSSSDKGLSINKVMTVNEVLTVQKTWAEKWFKELRLKGCRLDIVYPRVNQSIVLAQAVNRETRKVVAEVTIPTYSELIDN